MGMDSHWVTTRIASPPNAFRKQANPVTGAGRCDYNVKRSLGLKVDRWYPKDRLCAPHLVIFCWTLAHLTAISCPARQNDQRGGLRCDVEVIHSYTRRGIYINILSNSLTEHNAERRPQLARTHCSSYRL